MLFAVSSAAVATSSEMEAGSADDVLTSEEEDHLRDFFNQNSVEYDVQDELIAKLGRGEVWDSVNPDEEHLSYDEVREDGLATTVRQYADGSISVSKVSDPDSARGAGPSPTNVYSCTTTGDPAYGLYHSGCVADVNLGVIRMYFSFDWEHVRESPPTITRQFNRGHHLFGPGTLDNHRFVIMSDQDRRYAADFNGPIGEWTAYMGVRVGSGTPVTYNN